MREDRPLNTSGGREVRELESKLMENIKEETIDGRNEKEKRGC